MELFAGSANLTKALQDCGFSAFGVDHSFNSHRPKGPVLVADLTRPETVELVRSWMRSGRLLFLHAGPPCGTTRLVVPAPEHAIALWLLSSGEEVHPSRDR